MSVDAIIGLQRGDEGKGRFVDLAAGDYDVIARGNGGANAGHTIVPEGKEPIALHQIPSGITYSDKLNIIGPGVYVDPRRLTDEINYVKAAGITVDDHLLVSDTAHLVLPHHIYQDVLREGGAGKQGSTKSGIAYVASSKFLREGVRVEMIYDQKKLYELALAGLMELREAIDKTTEELEAEAKAWVASTENLKPYVADTVTIINDRIQAGDKILAEGAQAFWLDITHGMYPLVTSSATTVQGLLDGLGIAPKHLQKVTGVAKVIKSHVGDGPMVTEIHDPALIERVRGKVGAVDSEFGATTKRPRRVGYPDLVELTKAVQVNGVTEIVLSKMDHVSRFGNTFSVATAYNYKGETLKTAPSSAQKLSQCQPVYTELPTWEDISSLRDFGQLPPDAVKFIEMVEKQVGIPVGKIGVGPQREQVILR